MNINKNDIMKTAASHLRKLGAEVKAYRDLEHKREHVEHILNKLSENLESSEIMGKYAFYMEKSLDELKIVEKALELTKTGELSLGHVSSRVADNGTMDPLTAFLVDDYLQ
jgi:hypothetical protein